MKKKYFVNTKAQANGDHEVHDETCGYLPKLENRIYLGEFYNCQDAVRAARSLFTQSNGCRTCSNACHTG